MLPSRQALSDAEDYYRRTGDELEGFLSEETGFLPRQTPELSLPESHRAWDEIAARLPSLWRDVGVRAAVHELPLLRGTAEALATRYVRRASTILGMVAHSYVHSERDPHGELPDVLLRPWDDLGRRLGKSEPFMRYEDVTLGNWRKEDPTEGMTQENLRMLIPAVGIPTERRFYLTQVEVNARATPLVGAVVRAQEAIAREDDDAIETELLVMIETLRALLDDALLKLDPNPYSPTTVDPVLFGGIVADLAVPFEKHIPGPSGTAAPVFHVLDSFLGRKAFDSDIGVDAIRLRRWGPKALARFVAAISEGPGADQILARGSRRVRGLTHTLLDLYSGPRGWLEAHRIKAYGYIEMSFKAGRPVTIGGFGGNFHERPWRTVHAALDDARKERPYIERAHSARGVLVERTPASGASGAKRLVLDVHDEGVVYRAGDRCQVLPTNAEGEIRRTLRALGARGDEPIRLTPSWRLALRQRSEEDAREEVPVGEFLAYAQLRPLPRAVAKALVRLSGSAQLGEIVDARREDELELWEALELMASDGYAVGDLLSANGPGATQLAETVPPESPRLYSIASVASERAAADQIELTVEPVEFHSAAGPEPGARRGTASAYLRETARVGDAIPLGIVRPPRFHAPPDPRTPVLMLASGSASAPLLGLLSERASARDPGPAWLLLDSAADGSVEALRSVGVNGWLELEEGPIASEANAALIRSLIEPVEQGGRGAQVYVCGPDAFVQHTLEALRELGSPELVRKLSAARRLMFHITPTHTPWRGPGVLGDALYDNSELVLHNDAEHGYWFAIDGNVYDMTEFRHMHPGGAYIIDASAGMDASDEYAAVLHYRDPEINAMLAMYKIGAIRRLNFGGEAALQELFRAWARLLFLIVEMQNAFENDLLFPRSQTTGAEDARTLTPLKLMLFSKAQDRFEVLYYLGLSGGPFDELWRGTSALSDSGSPPNWMQRELARVTGESERERERLRAELRRSWERARDGEAEPQAAADAVSAVSDCNRRFFAELKAQVRDGLMLFEREEEGTREHADSLLEVLRAVPDLFAAYRRDIARVH